MKIFWAILIAVVLGAGAYAMFWTGSPTALVSQPPAPPVSPPMNRGVPADEGAFFSDTLHNVDPTTNPAAAPGSTPPVAPASPQPSPQPIPPIPVAIPAADPAPSSQGLTKQQVADAVAQAKKDAAAKPETLTPSPTSPASAPPSTTLVPNPPEGVKVTPQDDGSALIDDKFTLRGEGTLDHPYEITWDYLTSAEETYQPRLGKKTVPPRLVMLNDSYVKISGYIAFPIMATEPTEMLSMLNQWDGCCIGVPPTPYDAIEVKLKAPAEGEERLASYGAITGKFRVDPYLVKDWLVSLYMMDEGEVSRK